MSRIRHLVVVLGDQLDAKSAAFDGLDRERDVVWMAEVEEEATHVWSHKARLALFLSAMRHFRNALAKRRIPLAYRALHDAENRGRLAEELHEAVVRLRPDKVIVVEPGEWRVRNRLVAAAKEAGVALDIRPDRHFLCSRDEFAEHAKGRKQLRMEFFYRAMRRRTNTLMEGNQPAGARWNFDAENRAPFGRRGPGAIPAPRSFPPDAVSREVIVLVNKRFGDHPGSLDRFDWPVTAAQASQALEDFVENRLPHFGAFQDAMWTGMPYLYHSRLSAAMNLKLLDPRKAIQRAEKAYRENRASIASVEGFIRQILGWREYVRGVYWRFMPGYLDGNALEATLPLPPFYWTAETDMSCLREAIAQTLQYGYAHHIQRLMVTGLFALLLGVRPQDVHAWYLAVYVDAVEWVELPNTLGMSQFADGGIMASKPYVATGKYIQRMSNYCEACRYDPAKATGESGCPFTTLYWDFLMRHKPLLRGNPRMQLQLRNLEKVDAARRRTIRRRADALKTDLTTSSRT